MRQLMGINGENFLFWNTKREKCSELMRLCGTVTGPDVPAWMK